MSEFYPEKAVFIAPFALECATCSTVTELFDPRLHGYDGEQHSSAGMTGQGPRQYFVCAACQQTLFEIAVSLDYPFDDAEFEAGDVGERPQDYFAGFSLDGQCCHCHTTLEIAGYECA
jgi:hypothetical protein